jgi:hypothetical protein
MNRTSLMPAWICQAEDRRRAIYACTASVGP